MSTTESLRAALLLALTIPDDRSLLVALSGSDSSPAYAPSDGGRSPQDDDDPEATRLRALVDLAKEGDSEAFGQLYDHYVTGVFRYLYYRVGSRQLAEDLTSETFVRGLRAIQRFTWQGKDFGAWLTTIARNLVADHYKSSRARLEIVTEAMPEGRTPADGPEQEVMAHFSNQLLFESVDALPPEQRDCILMRFIQGLSIAQTAAALGRSEGAVKQLQLRAVRNLAKTVPEDLR
jgi:RNA polymerase sigma-70 factor (ECF subfamily)